MSSKFCSLGRALAVLAVAFSVGELVVLKRTVAQAPQSSGEQAPQMPPEFKEIWEKSQDLRPKQSTDTTPVPLVVGYIEYKIPRNYFKYYSELIKEIDVTYPDFQPLDETNAQCFRPSAHPEEVGCRSVGFWFSGPNGPSLRQMFENSRDVYRSQTPKQGPYGYQYYEIGPPNARLERYTKETPENDFIMLDRYLSNNPKTALWNDLFRLDDGNYVHFRFSDAELKDVEDIQIKIKRLMASFPARRIVK